MKQCVKHIVAVLFTATLLGVSSSAAFAADQAAFVEGKDYTRIVPAQPTSSGPDAVTIEEFFMYTCPHCFSFEPLVQAWLKKQPDTVNYRRVPLISLSRTITQLHGKAFYIAKQLGILDQIHMTLFTTIHVQGQVPDSKEELATFFQKAAGIDAKTFDKAFASFSVNSQVRRASVMAKRYRIAVTPTVIVDGKYRVQPGPDGAGSHERVLRVVDYLIQQQANGN